MKSVYLDYAAATPLDDDVRAAMRAVEDTYFNPSALYAAGVNARAALELSRREIAEMLGVKPVEITLTAGGTEANNLAIMGVMKRFPEAKLIVSAVEHDSVVKLALRMQEAGGSVELAPVDGTGIVDIERLAEIIDEKTVLVSIMLANNEVGSVQPVKEVADLVAQERVRRKKKGIELPIYLHSDACQATNYIDINPHRLGVDLMTLNAGKIYGPKQAGLLYVSSGVELEPIVYGGGQERGMRSGTESLVLAAGLSRALQKAVQCRKDETARLAAIQKRTMTELEQIQGLTVNGHRQRRLPNNIHVTIEDRDNERLLYILDEAGFMVATGSACSASDETPSHVLLAMGMSSQDARSSLRITMGRHTTQVDMDRFVAELKTLVS